MRTRCMCMRKCKCIRECKCTVQVHGAYLPHLGEFGVEEARREAAELKVGREHLVRVKVGVRVRVRVNGQG